MYTNTIYVFFIHFFIHQLKVSPQIHNKSTKWNDKFIQISLLLWIGKKVQSFCTSIQSTISQISWLNYSYYGIVRHSKFAVLMISLQMNPKSCGYYTVHFPSGHKHFGKTEVCLQGLTQKSMAQQGSKCSVRELKAGTRALAVPERGWGVSWLPWQPACRRAEGVMESEGIDSLLSYKRCYFTSQWSAGAWSQLPQITVC